MRAVTPWLLSAALAVHALPARAQDASANPSADGSANPSDAAAAAAPAENTGNCQSDAIPAAHAVQVEARVAPAQPVVGDRVIVTYRLTHAPADRVEFEPDPVAFAQPGDELEYARAQPERDRALHTAPGGRVYGEVSVAVQGFKTGEFTVAPQLARLNAAGDVLRVCTPTVRFRVRDPFGNTPHPRPQDITQPEVVTEDAARWRWIALALDALFLVVVITLAVSAYLRSRPKAVVPPPPPRPAWIVALEALDSLGHSDLLARGQTKDYYDAVSDIVRRYVGAARGFDALEMTTDEVLTRVRTQPLAAVAPAEIEHLLRECDLVKFARYVPSHEESEAILGQAYTIVRRGAPAASASAQKPPAKDQEKSASSPAAAKPEDEAPKPASEAKPVDDPSGRRA